MSAVVAVCKRKIHSLIISKSHCSSDKGTDRLSVIADWITHILDFSSVAKLPETSLQILFFNRSHVLCHMAVEAVAYIRTVGDALHNAVHLAELLYLKTAEALCRCSVNRVKIAVLFLKLVDFIVDIAKNLQRKLSVLCNGFSIIKLLQFV